MKSKYLPALAASLVLLLPQNAWANSLPITGMRFFDGIFSTIIYSLIGMCMAFLAFRLVDFVTPGDLGKEISEKQNIALAVLAGFTILGICIVIAAATVG
jgi:putative membrane protein